jgi:hypothetical protein
MYKNIFQKIFSKYFVIGLKVFLFLLLLLQPILSIHNSSLLYAQDIGADGNTVVQPTPPGGQSITTSLSEKKESCAKKGLVYGGAEGCVQRISGMACIPLPYMFSLTDCVTSLANFFLGNLFKLINWFLSNLVWVASLAFDFMVYFTIVKFKANISNMEVGGVGSAIFGNNYGLVYYLWGAIRDFLNILIFIIIIYYAVRSMFDGFIETRRRFVFLLIFSIITNFSLLFVKLAIDISNIFALQAYTLAVQPAGTDSFSKFRSFSFESTSKVESFGEYLMNSVDLNRLNDDSNAPENVKAEIKDMKDTFIFQLGRMIVYLGIIYILFFLAGSLLFRAGVFLISMITAPLIVFELFFDQFGKGSDSMIKELAENVKGVTKKFKNDFIDALIKGPVLIFAIFLIGVLAESIFSSGLLNTMQGNLSQMADSKMVHSSFAKSLFVFFKFAMFFVLCKIIIDKIGEISWGTGMSTVGKASANFLFGRSLGGAARLTGYGLQNTLGRYASNSDSLLGRGINRLQAGTRDWRNADGSTWSGAAKRFLGGKIYNATGAIKTGSYDIGNLVKGRLATKSGTLVGSAVSGITGLKEGSFGKRVTDSFSDRDKAIESSRVDKRLKELEEIEKNYTFTEEELKGFKKKAQGDTKIDDKVSQKLDVFKELLNNEGFVSALKGTALGTDFIHEGTTYNKDEADFFRKAINNDPEILVKIKGAEKKADEKILSEETRQKMSEAARKRPPISEETRQKLREARKKQKRKRGFHLSEEHKQKLSDSQKGKPKPRKRKNEDEVVRES